MADSTPTPLTVPSGGLTGTTEQVQVPATTTLPIRSSQQSMDPEQRLALIRENLAEFLDPELIENIIKEGRNPKIYWGTLNRTG
jgi:tyrosyl-tRNA synthetase